MKCIICRKPIDVQKTWTEGHNASPVFEGRCCTDCNENTVIPARDTLKALEFKWKGSSEDLAQLATYVLSAVKND